MLVCYKSTQSGPADPSGIATGTWRDPAGANRPENALTGGQYVGEKHFDWFPLRVSAAQGRDRIWRNTGLENQANGTFTNVGNDLVGWEWDARVNNGLEPAGVTTLAESPVDGRILLDAGPHLQRERHGARARHQVHVAERLARVRRGHQPLELGPGAQRRGQGEPDRRIQQATTNVLADMGALPETPAANIVLDDPNAPPLVTQRSPATNATGVDPAATVRATFSRAMDASTITPELLPARAARRQHGARRA